MFNPLFNHLKYFKNICKGIKEVVYVDYLNVIIKNAYAH